MLLVIILGLACLGFEPFATAATSEVAQEMTGEIAAPVSARVRLTEAQRAMARQGRLGWVGTGPGVRSARPAPVQWDLAGDEVEAGATWLMPMGVAGKDTVRWSRNAEPFAAELESVTNAAGQIELRQSGRPVLQYNYRTIEPGELIHQVSEGNRIYARARSDYIHPLYGPSGEVLTRDWAVDHPHHRGIYWAWPEVDYGQERGDLHALQKVFARPTGQIHRQDGPVFAEVKAENLWHWEDQAPIVREWTTIRAYRATAAGRVVDLQFEFTALKDGVTIARRGTTAYGGLNIRLATPPSQAITTHTDLAGARPRRAWSDLSGRFAAETISGLTVLQHAGNPEYPGDWVQYPELSWVQPTFPTAQARYALSRERPLVLRFRLWIHAGAAPGERLSEKLWDAYHAPQSVAPRLNP